jgi:hypothetical protein
MAALLGGSLAGSAPAAGESAAYLSRRPAATLLLPYFEVALAKQPGGKAKGVTTLISFGTAQVFAVVARVTIWSDLAVPVTAFDVYLTGYDAQTFDLFDVIEGRLPITGSQGQDLADDVSPHGIASQDVNVASCNSFLPFPPQLEEDFVAHMRASLTGKLSPLYGDCVGRDYGEKKPIARGFVTIDTVNQCSGVLPDSAAYFSQGGGAVAANYNYLWGDAIVVDRKKKRTRVEPLVHLRADVTDPLTDDPGDYTFNARLLAGSGVDNRQPLPTSFLSRFVNAPKDPLLPGTTTLVAWRDPKVLQLPFACGTLPSFFPLRQDEIVVFDEQENPQVPKLPPVPPLPPEDIVPFPAVAGKVLVGSPDFPTDFERGFIYLNLNHSAGALGGLIDDATAAQAHVTTVIEGKGSSSSMPAAELDSAAAPNHLVIFP